MIQPIKIVTASPEYLNMYGEQTKELFPFLEFSEPNTVDIRDTFKDIPGFKQADLTKFDVPTFYHHLPLPGDSSKLTITLNKNPDTDFNSTYESLLPLKGLSFEKQWLAVARGSCYALEGLWRGKLNTYNLDTVADDFEPDFERYTTNPEGLGFSPNNVSLVEGNELKFTFEFDQYAFDQGEAIGKKLGKTNEYADIHRFRWESFPDSVHFGLTIGSSKAFSDDPKMRINPKDFIWLETSRTDAPVVTNPDFREGLMLVKDTDGHICRIMTPVGEVSTYLNSTKEGLVVRTELENFDMIHSNKKVNEYNILAVHSAAVFALQAYHLGVNASVEALDNTFLRSIQGGEEFWSETLAYAETADMDKGDDVVTKVARFAGEAVTHPAIVLENRIAKDQIEQGFLAVEQSMIPGAIGRSAGWVAKEELGAVPVMVEKLMNDPTVALVMDYGIYGNDKERSEAIPRFSKLYDMHYKAYRETLSHTSNTYDKHYNMLSDLRNDLPINLIKPFGIKVELVKDEDRLSQAINGIAYTSLHKDSNEALRMYSTPSKVVVDFGKGPRAVSRYSLQGAYKEAGIKYDIDLYERVQRDLLMSC